MDEYIDVKINIFEYTGQHARVRRSLTIATLIREILREFDDLSGQPESYALYLIDHEQPLEQSYTIEQLDIQPWDELMLDYRQRSARRDLLPHERFSLRDEKSGKVYPIEWQPAIIGRPTKDPDHDLKLAINVAGQPLGETISRTHAQLTVRESVAYVERLAESNPVYLNGTELPNRQARPVHWGDRLEIGRSRLTLIVEQTQSGGFPVMPIEIPVKAAGQAVKSQEAESHSDAKDKTAAISQPEIARPAEKEPVKPASDERDTASAKAGGEVTELRRRAADAEGQLSAGAEETLPVSSPASLKLVMADPQAVEEGLVGQLYPIKAFPFEIGREALGVSSNSGVSRKHARIDYDLEKQLFTLTDLNSTNGVSINGVIIKPGQPKPLKDADEINLGKQVMIRFMVGK